MKEVEDVSDQLPTEGLKELPEGFEGRRDLEIWADGDYRWRGRQGSG